MPAPIRTEGDDADPVQVKVTVPMWLKRRMVEAAEAEAMSFTEWTKLALRLAVESSEAKRHPKRR